MCEANKLPLMNLSTLELFSAGRKALLKALTHSKEQLELSQDNLYSDHKALCSRIMMDLGREDIPMEQLKALEADYLDQARILGWYGRQIQEIEQKIETVALLSL